MTRMLKSLLGTIVAMIGFAVVCFFTYYLSTIAKWLPVVVIIFTALFILMYKLVFKPKDEV